MQKNNFQALTPWKESLIRMNENQFLSIAKMYLGTIKTPYNKERLIQDLVSFLCKDQNKNNLLALLSQNDVLLLSAIYYLRKAGRDTLLSFFDGVFSVFYLFEYLNNLEERLLVYRHYDEKLKQECYAINPLLEKNLLSYSSLSVLLPPPLLKESTQKVLEQTYLNSALLASWYSFVSQNPEICKTDGGLKRKTQGTITHTFPRIQELFLENLNKALINLSLFYIDGTSIYPNDMKWRAFSKLSEPVQKIYICVSSFSPFSREALIKHSKFAKNLLANIPKQGYTRTILKRLAFLLNFAHKEDKTERKTSYFSALVQRSQGVNTEDTFTHESLIERLLFFGLLNVIGENENGEQILTTSEQYTFHSDISQKGQSHNPIISIDAGFSVTFINKTNLSHMLSLVSCMNLLNYDTVCRFEISRNSCMRVFDNGEKSDNILLLLEQASGKPVSQNLSFSVKEWYETYCSASLYHGYVLQVNAEKAVLIENNPVLAPHIKLSLAAGIFILDFSSTEEALSIIEKSNLDFIGMPKRLKKDQESIGFTEISASATLEIEHNQIKEIFPLGGEKHLEKMKSHLKTLNLTPEQEEGLLERIDRKLIINETQLIGETIRSEKTEASGIDFVGKIQVVEQAISALNMVEVEGSKTIFIGRPLKIEKCDGDARLTLSKEDGSTIVLSIGQARKIRRFRPPLFIEEN